MYTKRVQIVNYGPIDRFDITFPFEGEQPKPVVLVGENGSGKSILLSHIVNGLISAKGVAYPETPEVDTGKVYKLRSGSYIKGGQDFYFGRVEFENNLYVREIRTRLLRQEYQTEPAGFDESIRDSWNSMPSEKQDYFDSNISINDTKLVEDIFSKNCILYFPSNRFEEPAWLNEENLKAQANYTDIKHVSNYTSRQIINYSPLHENQNWIFDVLYDRSVFQRTINVPFSLQGVNNPPSLPVTVHTEYSQRSMNIYEIALRVVQGIIENSNARFVIGGRHDRTTSIMENNKTIVPNIFQISSGESSLLNLFFSILRDFDLTYAPFNKAEDIRGIVVVDEIDLHLHTNHQYHILPHLIQMFPKVQFIITTHSPLFVLGMRNIFGESGFSLYRMPDGRQISPEEFREFENAYQTFAETGRFMSDIRNAIRSSQNPVVYMEGVTDVKYLWKAAEHLGHEPILEKLNLDQAGSSSNLSKIWNTMKIASLTPRKMLLVYDCDTQMPCEQNQNCFRQRIPTHNDHPVKKGIENLLAKSTLERAREHKPAFIDIEDEHTKTDRGEKITVPETWSVNKNEKTNLCNWLCENGTSEDFQHFQVIFDIIENTLGPESDDNGDSTV